MELLPVVTDVSGLGGAAAVCFAAHVVLVSFLRFAEPIGTGLLAGSTPKDTVERSPSIVSDLGALLIRQQAVNRQGQIVARWQAEGKREKWQWVDSASS